MKSASCCSDKDSLITFIEFGLKGIDRVVFQVFFCLILTSVFGEPDSFITEEIRNCNKSWARNLKSQPKFKRRDCRVLSTTSFHKVLTWPAFNVFFPMIFSPKIFQNHTN